MGLSHMKTSTKQFATATPAVNRPATAYVAARRQGSVAALRGGNAGGGPPG